MDILLCNPYYTQLASYYSFYRPAPPIGLMYLAGYLRKSGMESRICELGVFDAPEAIKIGTKVRFGISDEKISEIIKNENPKIIGITNMYSVYYWDVVEISKTIKKINPDIYVVVGGNHASTYWQYMLKNYSIDFVVIGEGENTFLELCKRLLKKESVGDLPGISYRDQEGRAVRTQPAEFISNLDEIPFPATDMIDYKKYLGSGNPFSMRPPSAGIISSRGCPGKCVYCTVKAVWGRTWRGRTPVDVVNEIVFLQDKYGVHEFSFLDDSASIDRRRWEDICDEIIRKGLDIKWSTPNGIAHWTLTKDTLDKMRKAGCYRITFGIESGNPETRKFLGKPYSLAQAKELIQYANRIGMWTICTNIIGFPYEDAAAINDTVNFAKESGTDFACFFLLMPQPTSDVYEIFKNEGLLDFGGYFENSTVTDENFEKINYILNETGCNTRFFKKDELNMLQKKAYRSFIIYRVFTYILNPLKILRKIHSMEDLFYILRMLNKGIGIFFRTLNPLNKKSSDYIYAQTKQSVG